MLSAASLCYKRRIEIYKQNQNQSIVIDSPDATVSHADSLKLGYVSTIPSDPESHYISLRRDVGNKENKTEQDISK
jgi:hypothetical protein